MIDAGLALESRAAMLHENREYSALAALLEAQDRSVVAGSVRLAFWLADAWRRVGRGTDALRLLADARSAFARAGNVDVTRHRLNLEGMLHFEAGDVSRAEACWRELLARASDAGDADFVARANNNLGVVCTLHLRPQEAVACYERAIAAYRRIGRRRGIAQAHQNLGITFRELGFAAEADHHFLQAIRYAGADGSMDEVARAEQERALLILLTRRDAPLARATARRALRTFESLREPGGAADARRVLGLIELGDGALDEAGAQFDVALRSARELRLPLIEAETLEALAALAERMNDLPRMQQLQHDADAIFRRVGATAWGRRTRARVAYIAAHANR